MASFLFYIGVVVDSPESKKSTDKSEKRISSPASAAENEGTTETNSTHGKELKQVQKDPTSGKAEILDYHGHTTAVAGRDIDSYTQDTVDLDRSASDSIDALKIRSENATGAERVSFQTLSTDDISVDARACALPKRRPKNAKLKHEQLADEERDSSDFEKDKDFEISEKKTKEKSNDDMENFIRNLVKKQVSKKHDIKFFDAAIVYDKSDYDKVISFRNDLIYITKSKLQEDLRIELFDSEEFVQSKIMVVEDVIDRCSVVLIYLSTNFTSPELHLFIEEAIGLSRFGYNDPEFQSRVSSQKQWVLKPVHTKPRKTRDYKTPIGLLTVNGIDWFDRSSEHTMNQIVHMMRMAVNQRNQRDTEVNTNNAYKNMFGSLPDTPHLGPPFNRTPTVHSASVVETPSDQPAYPLISHPSNDAMSLLSGSPVFPASPYNFSGVGVDAHPSLLPDAQSIPRHDAGFLHSTNTSLGGSINAHGGNPVFQSRHEPGNLHHGLFPPGHLQQQYSSHINQASPYSLHGSQLGHIYQSAGLQNENHPSMQQSQIPMQANYPSVTMQTDPAVVFPPQMDLQSQPPVHFPNVRPGQYNPYQDQHVSQDALPSSSRSYMLGERNDTQPSSQISVVSNATVKSNLSTDDDVEVDTSHKDPIRRVVSSKPTKKDRFRGANFTNDFENDSEESDFTSDSDSDEDVPVRRKVIKEIVNIVGCKTVQLGTDNRVKEIERKRMTSDLKSKKSATTKQSTYEIKTAAKDASDASCKKLQSDSSNLGMNISLSVENMCKGKSTRVVSKDFHCSEDGGNSSENGSRNGREPNFHEHRTVTESNANSQKYENVKADSKHEPKLQLFMNRLSDNVFNQTYTRQLFSPDENFSEEQLFGTGLSEADDSFHSSRSSASQEAAFSFSKLSQKTSSFKHIVHVNLNETRDQTFSDNNCVYSDPD